MPIEHINKTDTLNEGRVKMNDIITAFNEGVPVADKSIGTDKLADNSVTQEILNENHAINFEWLSNNSYDLNYIWDESNRIVDPSVLNNPIKNGIGLLKVFRGKTGKNERFLWVTQIIENINNTNGDYPKEIYLRSMRVNEDTTSIVMVENWEDISNKKNPSTLLNRIVGVKTAKNVLNKDSNDKIANGLYNNSGTWITNNNFDSFKIEADLGDEFHVRNDTLTIVGFSGEGNVTEVFSDKKSFIVEKASTKFFYYPVRKDLLDTEVIAKGNFYPQKYIGYEERDTIIGGLNDSWEGKQWVALGTSLTANGSGKYANRVASELGLVLDNRGVSGGGISPVASEGNPGNTTMQAAQSLEDFEGLVTIECGPNDWQYCPLGELGDTSDDTWYGCLDEITNTVINNTSARLVFIVLNARALNSDGSLRSVYWENQFNKKYFDYVKAVEEVANMYGVPTINCFSNSGLGGENFRRGTLTDHIHHTDLGGMIVSDYIVKQLSYSINPFPGNFKP